MYLYALSRKGFQVCLLLKRSGNLYPFPGVQDVKEVLKYTKKFHRIRLSLALSYTVASGVPCSANVIGIRHFIIVI